MMVAVAAYSVWLGVMSYQAKVQREAVAAIKAAGGEVFYDCEVGSDGLPLAADHVPPPPGPNWLRNLFGPDYFATVVGVNGKDQLGDGDLAPLEHLTHLRCLLIGNDTATDVALDRIKGLTQLETLMLYETTQITDAGLEHVEHLTHLKNLILWDCVHVTDVGLKHLKGLPRLAFLGLPDTPITDAGLEDIKCLTSLKKISLDGTKVTEQGSQDLLRAMPDLKREER